ncbi:MAG: MmgE/PrpD family protein [Bacillota bacterium]|nr:hypothetical protein [Bacillota bacterium]
MNEWNQLLSFAQQTSLGDVPPEVVARAKLILLDSMGAIIHGNQTEEVRQFATMHAASDGVPVLGLSILVPEVIAAMANAQGMVSQELDEGNVYAKGHPASHILPALLAVAYRQNSAGAPFLESFLLGYEISARLGHAIRLKPAIHPHGNWAMVGGSLAVGKLLGWTGEKLAQALAMSASLPMVSLWENAFHGHRIRDVYVGVVNAVNTLVPSLVSAGYTASLNGFQAIFDGILGEGLDWEKAVSRLGSEYFLMKNYFKELSYCRYCHSPIEAVAALIQQESIDWKTVRRIDVYTYRAAAQLNRQTVENAFAAKFSIPAAMADWLCQRYPELDAEALAKKIFVHEDAAIEAKLPAERNSRVVVTLSDGTVLSHYQVGAKGDPQHPFQEDDVKQKLLDLAGPVIGRDRCFRLIDVCLNIERHDVDDLIRLCIGP